MHIEYIFVGDNTTKLSDIAKSYDNNAILITHKNFTSLNRTIKTAYTSVHDLGHDLLSEVIDNSDTICYVPWKNSSGREVTENILNFFKVNKNKKIINYTKIASKEKSLKLNKKLLELRDTRKSSTKQIWIAGCSISYGTGVNKLERYGQLIADKLNLPVSFLTTEGAGIPYAADQILRSDIASTDLVVWGLTSENRFSFFDKETLYHITTGSFPKHNKIFNKHFKKLYFSSAYENSVYQSVSKIHQVNNFCSKIGANLLLVGLIDNLHWYLENLENYFYIFNRSNTPSNKAGDQHRFLDLGSDNSHPGPKTHKFYADQIYNKLYELSLI